MSELHNPDLQPKYNILWIMTDEQRCDSLGCYGSPWAVSPSIDYLAEKGTLFEEAITPAPTCVPARTSMITGLSVPHHGIWSNAEYKLPHGPDLISRFAAAGYSTASFGKSHYAGYETDPVFSEEHEYCFSPLVHPEHYSEGFVESDYDVVKYNSPYTTWVLGGRFPGTIEQTSEYRAANEGMQWLDRHLAEKGESPFLLRVSLNAPHTPVSVPEPWLASVKAEDIKIPSADMWDRSTWPVWYRETLWEYANSGRLSEEQIAVIHHDYYCQCAFLDSMVGKLLRYLEEHGLLSNTIIAFCSDHGTHLGDYGFVQKQTFFNPSVNVPFIVKVPGVAEGTRIKTPVSLGQFVPTLLGLCGLDSTCDYAPLTESVLSGEEPPLVPVTSDCTFGSIAKWGLDGSFHLGMTRFGDWKSIQALEDQSVGLLFNVKDDPLELHNLFGKVNLPRMLS
jgi:arylsulfatase A-like enzyme